jgi:hypothetical protein
MSLLYVRCNVFCLLQAIGPENLKRCTLPQMSQYLFRGVGGGGERLRVLFLKLKPQKGKTMDPNRQQRHLFARLTVKISGLNI